MRTPATIWLYDLGERGLRDRDEPERRGTSMMTAPLFRNRTDAGRRLADRLGALADRPGTIVLALPRGGVPVAHEIAVALRLPLDVFVVRKLGVPGHEELAMGAIASGGLRVLDEALIAHLGVTRPEIEDVTRAELAELERRDAAYRGTRPAPAIAGRTIVLVDDGLATGASMTAAVIALKRRSPARLVVAVPIAAPEAIAELRQHVAEIVCLATPSHFGSVGACYDDFSAISDDAVRALLEDAAMRQAERAGVIPTLTDARETRRNQ